MNDITRKEQPLDLSKNESKPCSKQRDCEHRTAHLLAIQTNSRFLPYAIQPPILIQPHPFKEKLWETVSHNYITETSYSSARSSSVNSVNSSSSPVAEVESSMITSTNMKSNRKNHSYPSTVDKSSPLYKEKRQKNNEAARKSRQKKKQNDMKMQQQLIQLQKQNQQYENFKEKGRCISCQTPIIGSSLISNLMLQNGYTAPFLSPKNHLVLRS